MNGNAGQLSRSKFRPGLIRKYQTHQNNSHGLLAANLLTRLA